MPTTTLEQLRTEKRDDIMALATKHGISNVRVFGSVARGEDRPDSDIDFLISLERGRNIMDWSGFWVDLEDLLGKKVDVFPEKNLRWSLKEPVLTEAITL